MFDFPLDPVPEICDFCKNAYSCTLKFHSSKCPFFVNDTFSPLYIEEIDPDNLDDE